MHADISVVNYVMYIYAGIQVYPHVHCMSRSMVNVQGRTFRVLPHPEKDAVGLANLEHIRNSVLHIGKALLVHI